MAKIPETPDRAPDWTIDLGHPPRPVQTDARLPAVRDAIRDAQTHLLAIVETMAGVEDVIRDCAARGMTRDEIADQCALSIEAVDRVIAGGTLFDFPR
jgi:hypothetical protein